MNRLSRLAAWAVVGLGALTTIATSRAPSSGLTGSFERTLAAAETTHVTFHVSQPALDHMHSLGGTLRFRAQAGSTAFSFVEDGSEVRVSVPPGRTVSAAVTGSCPSTGGCDLGISIEAAADSEDVTARVFLDVSVASQNDFPAGATVTAEED